MITVKGVITPVITRVICDHGVITKYFYWGSARTSPIHKEKFNVPVNGDEHKDLFNFVRHLKTFTGLSEIAKSKGLGENPKITIARVQKAGSGVETFSLRTQDAWKYEFDTLIRGNGMLQGTSSHVFSCNI